METLPVSQGDKILETHANLSLTPFLNASLPFHRLMNNAVLGILLGTLSLLTVIMNILVLLAVRKERTLHTVGNLYIVSLSLADLIVGATVMPLNMVYLLEDAWKLGRVACQFWLVMDYVASTASIFSLFILCLDRYRSVRHPLRYLKYRTRGRATLMICGAWLLSLTWVVPILGWRVFAHVDRKPELESKCDTDFRFVTWFKVLTAILNFYIPSFLMLWFYSQIFIAVREHYKQWEDLTSPRVPMDEDGTIRNPNQLQRSFYRASGKETLALQAYSQNEGVLDQYTLDQQFNSKDTHEENSDSLAEKKPKKRKPSFFNISKQKIKNVRDSNDISSISQEEDIEDGTSSKQPSLPLRFLQHEDNAELKMFVSVNDCNVLVPNSVANICEITTTTDVHKYTTVLCNDEAAQSPTSPWGHDSSPQMDAGNALTLKQTWQRFCVQSRQCVQNMRVHKERKAARQLGFIIGAFMVCWIPYFITFMVMALCNTCVHHDLHMFTIWLGYINSTLNPFIYPLCNENFQRVFKKIFCVKQ